LYSTFSASYDIVPVTIKIKEAETMKYRGILAGIMCAAALLGGMTPRHKGSQAFFRKAFG